MGEEAASAPVPKGTSGALAAVPGASKFKAAPKLGAGTGGPLKLVPPTQQRATFANSKLENTVLPHTVPPKAPAKQGPDHPAPKPVPRLVKPPPQKHTSPAPLAAVVLNASTNCPAKQEQVAVPKRPKPPSYPPPGFEVQSKAGLPSSPGQRVVISNFTRDLEGLSRGDLIEHIRVQLEAFGKLSLAPFLTPTLDGRTRAVAAFEDPESAQQALEALSGTVFDVALGAARGPAREGPAREGPAREGPAGEAGRAGRAGRGGAEPEPARAVVRLYLDELEMPLRPEVVPAVTDREVWVEALPADDGELRAVLAAFGEPEDILRALDPQTGAPGSRGYVRFRDHAAAERCVRAGTGVWSESERALASRLPPRPTAVRAYPEDVLALLLGPGGDGGEEFAALRKSCGLGRLAVLGPGLGGAGESGRLCFEAEGEEGALAGLRPELEIRLAEAHGGVCAHLERLGLNWLDDREAEWRRLQGRAAERPGAQREASAGEDEGECREPVRKKLRPFQPRQTGEPESGGHEPPAGPQLISALGLDGAPELEGS